MCSRSTAGCISSVDVVDTLSTGETQPEGCNGVCSCRAVHKARQTQRLAQLGTEDLKKWQEKSFCALDFIPMLMLDAHDRLV